MEALRTLKHLGASNSGNFICKPQLVQNLRSHQFKVFRHRSKIFRPTSTQGGAPWMVRSPVSFGRRGVGFRV